MRFSSIFLGVAGLAIVQSAHAQTVQDTMQNAIQYHPAIEAAEIDIELASEALISARAARSIQISAGVTSQLQSQSTDRAFGIDVGETWVNQASVEASVPLFTSGEIPAGIAQAEHSLDAARYALSARRQDVLASAIEAHLNVDFARRAVRIRERNLDRLRRQFEAAGDRFEAGVVTRTDVSLAEARLRGAEAELSAARAALTAAWAQYSRLTGQGDGTLAAVTQSDLNELPSSLTEALELLSLQNPTLRRFSALEQLAGAAIQVAESQRGVRVEAFGSAALQNGTWDNDFNDSNAVLGARARIPLYTGGRLESAVRQANLNRQQIRYQREDTRLSLTAALSEVWAAHIAAQSGVVAATQEIEANRTALEGAEIEVSVGLRTTLDLLDQEQQLLESELRLADAERSVYVTASRILSLLGSL